MIKLIAFDLDGVLVQAKNIHFQCLNEALGQKYAISWQEHLNRYDGLKTNQKLEMLSKEKGLPRTQHQEIWKRKQILTLKRLSQLKQSPSIKKCIQQLSNRNYKIACCSNSIRKTTITVLAKLGIIEYFDLIISNEDVKNSKPHPEMYWNAMSILNCFPEQTLIIQDSPYGLMAANRSKARVMRVKSPQEVTYQNIQKYLEKQYINPVSWKDPALNVLIPMAGAGSRFAQAGYTFPKPLIQVKGKPMIQVVVENLNIDANYIYIVQKQHRIKYNLDTLLNLITPNCKVIQVDGLTQGAACTALLAKELINNTNPLFLANSDQFVEWDSVEFMYKMQQSNCDGGIVTFEAIHPKWSFVKTDEYGRVLEVAQKKPISNQATVGYYYWKHGSDFVKYAQQMIKKNIRVNNEFYICPVFNQAIQDNKVILTSKIQKMWGLGTPQDLEYFVKNFDK